jgi:undecaprenyl-diphosphatase
VLLDVHWLSDVVAGLALGWAWFALCAIAFGGRLLRFGVTAERIERAAAAPRTGVPGPDTSVKPAKPGT